MISTAQIPPVDVITFGSPCQDLSVAGKQKGMHDQQAVLHPAEKPPRKYIVRRLTPLECCRLQGYPDRWTQDVAIPEPTEKDIAFFAKVWEWWGKPKTRRQIIKWLKDPQTDSAEYKAYGNSLAIPCAADVIGRVAGELREG